MLNTAMNIEQNSIHVSVLKKEIGEILSPRKDGIYVDATLGFGGHTLEILGKTDYQARLICFEIDADALAITRSMLAPYSDRVTIVNKNFTELDTALDELGIDKVDGIVADLGLSSYQLEGSGMGFSFLKDEYLDMRADKTKDTTAADLLSDLDGKELAEIFSKYGEERFAVHIARAIVKQRQTAPVTTTAELRSIIQRTIPQKYKPRKINCSTKVFQALRVAVNNELDNLRIFLEKSIECLAVGGVLGVISFNSLEDKIVKQTFRQYADPCTCPPDLALCGCGKEPVVELISRGAIEPTADEVTINPRSRSAKLRAVRKL